MNEFEKLIRDGWVEINTAKKSNFERAIEHSHLKLSKKSVSEDNRFILLGTEDERDQVEMRKGMTYFYNPLMWRVTDVVFDKRSIGMKWITEDSLANFPAWSGGKDTLDFLVSHGLCGEVEEFIDQIWPDEIPDAGEVNEFLWFDIDAIAEYIGYQSWEDMERNLDGEEEEEEE